MNRSEHEKSSSRAKALLWLGLLFVAAFLGDRILAMALHRVVLHSQMRYSKLYRGGLEKDIVILGDSRAVNSFLAPLIEKETGRSVINLAHNGISTEIAEVILRDYLARNAKPELVVLDVSNVLSPSDLVIQNFQLYLPHSHGLQRLLKTYAADRYRGCRLAHLYRFNNEVFLRSLFYLNHSDQNWVNRNTIGPSLLAKTREQDPFAYTLATSPEERLQGRTIKPENLAALQAICRLTAAEGIELRLLISPYLPLYREKMINYDRFRQDLQKAAGTQAPTILDYAAAVRDTKAFGDRLHLNETGARRFFTVLQADDFFALKTATAPKETMSPIR